MSNETTNTAVPKLRFREFEEAGEWPFLNGNKLFDQISNKNHNSDLPILAITQEHGAIPRHLIDYNVVVTEKSVESYKVIEPGDFIISLRSFQGGIEYSTYTGICSPAYIILRRKNSGTDAFFKQYFKTPAFIGDLNKNIEGLRDGKMVSYKQFSDLFLPTPSLAEQQKIAATLSSLDDLLTAHSAKLAALQAQKRGLMQGLFPAEGETVPKLRFPEFREAGEWEEKTLGEVATFLNGRAYKQEELLESGKYKVLRLGNLFSNNHWYYSDLELEENKYCDNGDLLYAWSASFGPRMWTGEKVIYHYHIWKVLEKKGLGKLFLFILLDNETNKIKDAQANGLGMLHITKGSIEAWKCLIPKDEAEQQKIADCLSSLDNRITAQTQKIEALKLHKKGLMQGLFPAAAEPTA